MREVQLSGRRFVGAADQGPGQAVTYAEQAGAVDDIGRRRQAEDPAVLLAERAPLDLAEPPASIRHQ
ncbi:hypothetical protein [Streptomyces sp. NBC_01006]|uniref:hypothetical protein n=1 Tax=Streptomyces sp. NBC_01006 TaxID=2903716 RepID=UPI003864A805|nr:hypothetical protein OG509_33240 [Streptomyces sp. NBC_01006]